MPPTRKPSKPTKGSGRADTSTPGKAPNLKRTKGSSERSSDEEWEAKRRRTEGSPQVKVKTAFVGATPVPTSVNKDQISAYFPAGVLGLMNEQTSSPLFVKEDGSLEFEEGARYCVQKQGPNDIPTEERKSGSNSSQADNIQEAERLITVSSIWEPRLTETIGMKDFVGREGSLRQLKDHIKAIRHYCTAGGEEENRNETPPSWTGKGQPLIGMGAASGVGKSRLLQEFRSEARKSGTVVITLTYNSLESLTPHAQERSCDKDTIVKAFLSRLLCMMLPKKEFDKIGRDCLWNKYSVTRADVVAMMAKKFAGKNVLILGDEFVSLSSKRAAGGYDDTALDVVVSEFGHVCAEVTSELGENFCIGFFTALSRRIVEDAHTRSGRTILLVDLPLLSREVTLDLVRRAKKDLDKGIPEVLFALTAGHARLLEAFLAGNTLKWGTTTLEGIIPPLKKQGHINALQEEDVITILADRGADADKLDLLCRRSLVQRLEAGGYVAAPAELYQWAAGSRSDLGVDLKAFLDACWHEMFLKKAKQGLDGKPLEDVLSSYERLRRHWLSGTVALNQFFKGSSAAAGFRWSDKVTFDTLGDEVTLSNPSLNTWKSFDLKILNNANTLYKQDCGGNFPRYDWFSVVEVEGKKVPLGSQSKHGRGKLADPDPKVISVKFSTLADPLTEWKDRGWLVLDGKALREYLGSTLAAAAVCVLYHPKGPTSSA
jgi:hypothetical protein